MLRTYHQASVQGKQRHTIYNSPRFWLCTTRTLRKRPRNFCSKMLVLGSVHPFVLGSVELLKAVLLSVIRLEYHWGIRLDFH